MGLAVSNKDVCFVNVMKKCGKYRGCFNSKLMEKEVKGENHLLDCADDHEHSKEKLVV